MVLLHQPIDLAALAVNLDIQLIGRLSQIAPTP